MTAISQLLCLPGNDSCADCNAPSPNWASCGIGVFVCDSCAEVHKTLQRLVSHKSGCQHLHDVNAVGGRHRMDSEPRKEQSYVTASNDDNQWQACYLRAGSVESDRSTTSSVAERNYGGDWFDKHAVIHVTSSTFATNPQLIRALVAGGNNRAKLYYERLVPVSYRRPTPSDPQVLREEWIRSKYEREEFTEQSNSEPDDCRASQNVHATFLTNGQFTSRRRPCDSYQSGYKEGHLWKRGREDKRFNRRWFVLDQTENTLRYYNQENVQSKLCYDISFNLTNLSDAVKSAII